MVVRMSVKHPLLPKWLVLYVHLSVHSKALTGCNAVWVARPRGAGEEIKVRDEVFTALLKYSLKKWGQRHTHDARVSEIPERAKTHGKQRKGVSIPPGGLATTSWSI